MRAHPASESKSGEVLIASSSSWPCWLLCLSILELEVLKGSSSRYSHSEMGGYGEDEDEEAAGAGRGGRWAR